MSPEVEAEIHERGSRALEAALAVARRKLRPGRRRAAPKPPTAEDEQDAAHNTPQQAAKAMP